MELVVPCLMLRRTARLLCFFIPLFRFLSWLFFPVVILSHFAAVRAREKAEEQGEESVETTAEDEIMSLVAQNEEDGEESELAEDERRMIAGALELDNIDVHEIMTPRVDIDGIDQTATLENQKKKL